MMISVDGEGEILTIVDDVDDVDGGDRGGCQVKLPHDASEERQLLTWMCRLESSVWSFRSRILVSRSQL